MIALLLFPLLAMDGPNSAELCGACHRSIHEAWKQSSHATSMESRLFQDSLEMAVKDFGPETRRTCLSCHAPLAVESGDLSLTRKTSWEGVTCDYCHSIRDVNMGGTNPKAQLQIGPAKTGPIKDAASTAHGSVFSAIHESSQVCAPCHEYRNSSGFPVLTTYSEWRDSGFGKAGVACQSCHMPQVKGDVVDPHVKRTKTATVNLHHMPGSHSLQQLTSAIRASLSAVREGNQIKVTVTVSNESAGHHLPTGSPIRRIVLEMKADSFRGHHFREERVYQRRVADAQGNLLQREHFVFLKGASVVSDTRLSAGEKRAETFLFPIPQDAPAKLEATFRYYFSPMARTEAQKRVTFLTLSRLIR